MTHLRKMMLEDLQRRNYAETTINSYIRIVEDFSQRFHRPPDRLGPQQIREYQAELFKKRKLAPSTVTVYLAALRFFYTKTLKRGWSVAETPYPKRAEHVPSIMSQEEVARLIDAARTPFHRTLLMTLYATGVRRAELTHLKISDVDSQRMIVHVQGGKGRKDRDVMLSPTLLKELREHWRRFLLEQGADLRNIQMLLGHNDLEQTTIYLHVSERRLNATASPLDSLKLKNKSPQDE